MLKFSRSLHYAAWLALGATACSSDTIQRGAITLAMSTDMTVTADVKNVVLYVWRVDDSGRTLLRREEATLDPVPGASGLQRVRLPSTYVIESNDEPARVQARLVAFDGSDQPTQMREVRTQVPRRDDNRVVRMPLLWVNQNNVSGPAFTSENAGVGTQSTSDADAEGMAYVARCGADMTEDDRGVCVSIDFARDEADLQREEIKARMPLYAESGLEATMDENASCYDVSLAFHAPDPQGALPATVRRIAKADLVTSSEGCSVALDADFPVERLNAAVLTRGAENGGFEAGSGWGADTFLRPLAAGSLFQRSADGRRLELPSAVCTRLGEDAVDSLLLSSTTTAWKGGESLCAEWNVAKGERESGYDGAPPTPFDDSDAGVDAGPDASPEPDGGPAVDDIVSKEILVDGLGTYDTLAIDGFRDDVGIVASSTEATMSVATRFIMDGGAFEMHTLAPRLDQPVVRAVRLNGRTEIYAGGDGDAETSGVFHLPADGGQPKPVELACPAPMTVDQCLDLANSGLAHGRVGQLGSGAALMWVLAPQEVIVSPLATEPENAHIARYTPNSTTAVGHGRAAWPTPSWDRTRTTLATGQFVAGGGSPLAQMFNVSTGRARQEGFTSIPPLLSLHALEGVDALLGRTTDGPYLLTRTDTGSGATWQAASAWPSQPSFTAVSPRFASLPGSRVAMSSGSEGSYTLDWFKVSDGALQPDPTRTPAIRPRFAKLAIASTQDSANQSKGWFYAAYRCAETNADTSDEALQVRKIPWDKLDYYLSLTPVWGCEQSPP